MRAGRPPFRTPAAGRPVPLDKPRETTNVATRFRAAGGNQPVHILLLILGLVLLTVGGEFLIRGASRLAVAVGISPLVIGLTVVAYGTSMPELAVSAVAGLRGASDIAVANVVGSNIFNVLFILGACALILPLTVSVQLVRRDVPLMIGATVVVTLMALDGHLMRIEGLLLVLSAVAYTVYSIWASRREHEAVYDEYAAEATAPAGARSRGAQVAGQVGLILLGLVLLVLGSRWLVDGAVSIARALGISEAVIGLTIIAAGTSLPEVATSIMATIRGQRDIAIGNVVGSNIFNLLAILGVAGMITPGGLIVSPAMVRFDVPIMLGVAALCLPVFYSGLRISRLEGFLFLLGYVAYLVALVFTATGRDPENSVKKLILYGGVLVFSLCLSVAVRSWHLTRRGRAAA